MRCSVFIATSLDGFIARRDGSIDWLPQPDASVPSEDHGYKTFLADVDAIVMGRNTFDLVLTFPGWPYDRPVYVLTHRELPPLPEGAVAERVSGTPPEVVAALARKGHRHLYVDGGSTITQFLASGLIDRMTITTIPVLIGDGLPLFGRLQQDIRWTHEATKAFPSGLVQSTWQRRPRQA
ncbi:MAG TPA: dihydrofolate reductase family protein [Candidatus Thermoplasmatota archaeon]|nr:dihydrofolate reductase family protein [Candidatus Thermoplasmatota archaeon]